MIFNLGLKGLKAAPPPQVIPKTQLQDAYIEAAVSTEFSQWLAYHYSFNNLFWYVFKNGQVYYMSFAFVSDVCLSSINVKAYTVFMFYFIRVINEVKGVQVACTIT
jgi:hypothetical protein